MAGKCDVWTIYTTHSMIDALTKWKYYASVMSTMKSELVELILITNYDFIVE